MMLIVVVDSAGGGGADRLTRARAPMELLHTWRTGDMGRGAAIAAGVER
jgi:hypothetical protein